MRSVLLRTLAVLGAGGLVLGGVLYVASTVDGRPPEVSGSGQPDATTRPIGRSAAGRGAEVKRVEAAFRLIRVLPGYASTRLVPGRSSFPDR